MTEHRPVDPLDLKAGGPHETYVTGLVLYNSIRVFTYQLE